MRMGAVLVLFAAASLATPGCRSHSAGRSSESLASTGAREALRTRAEAERRQPDARARAAPPPKGVDTSKLAPVPETGEAGRLARMPLAEALNVVAAPAASPVDPPPPPTRRPDPDGAMRSYAGARLKMMDGNPAGAIADLRRAAELDPSAGEPWRELGEAQFASGSRATAMISFSRAVAAGLRDPRVLEALGRDALELHKAAEAAWFLGMASQIDAAPSDPALPYLIESGLADALEQLGYIAAALEARTRVLASLPDRFTSATRFQAELSSIYRRRGDLWLRAGDSALRLGDDERAIVAYEQASQYPALEAEGNVLTARKVYAAMRSGRPADAALTLVQDVSTARAPVDEPLFGLIRHVGAHSTIGPLLSDALAETTTDPEGQPLPRTIARAIVRARTAALSRDQARAVLADHLRGDPDDAEALRVLVATYFTDQSRACVRAVAGLVGASPQRAEDYADALLRSGNTADRLLVDARDTGRAGALLSAWINYRLARTAAAEAALPGRAEEPALRAAVSLARISIAMDTGRWADAESALQEIESLAGEFLRSPSGRLVHARALATMQRYQDALDVLSPALADTGLGEAPDLETLLAAATLAGVVGAGPDSERWLLQAASLDPYDERTYQVLLSLYAPNGAFSDSEKFGITARRLRQAAPGGRLTGLLRAQEMLSRSNWSQAEADAKWIVGRDPYDAVAFELLFTAWQRGSTAAEDWTDREAYIRSITAAHPESTPAALCLARILAATNRADEGLALLRDRYASHPQPETARTLESILRDSLNRVDDADQATLARLESPSRSIDASIEYAGLLVRLDRVHDAAAALNDALPPRGMLSDDQRSRVLALLAQVAALPLGGRDAAALADLSAIFEFAVAHQVRLPAQLHERRVSLLISSDAADEVALLAAADLIARQLPTAGITPYARVAQLLAESDHPERSLSFTATVAERPGNELVDLYTLWLDLACSYADRAAVKRFVEAAARASFVAELIARVTGEAPSIQSQDPRADLVYTVAMVASGRRSEQAAEPIYRLALEYDPAHPWALNNLGYSLVEQDRNIAEAAEMLERAWVQLPRESSIADSLGWARYKQGIMHDVHSETGEVRLEGAITLLRRAIELRAAEIRAAGPRGEASPVVQDHLGDALWVDGQRQEAAGYWRAAAELLRRQLLEHAQRGEGGPAVVSKRDLLEAILGKLKAVDEGGDPRVAAHSIATSRP